MTGRVQTWNTSLFRWKGSLRASPRGVGGLAHQSAGHRLLLILSDGRPNDVDAYQSEYGVEDARQAIMEARASGVYPCCITVDRDASEYLPRIFGSTGHTIPSAISSTRPRPT